MKCPTCKKGEMVKKKDVMKEDGVSYEYYFCSLCKEEILDMGQLQSIAKKYRKLRKAKEVTFSKWGNSIAVRIPNEIAQDLSIRPGNHGLLQKEKKSIKITLC